MQKKFRAIFWDNDGILVDTEPFYAEAVQQVFDRIGCSDDAKKMYLEVGIVQGKSVWPIVAEKMGLSEKEAESLRLEAHRNYQNIILERKYFLLPEVKETVKSLHEHYPMAIVTSSHRDNFDILHKEKEILPYFRFVLTREDFTHTKPHPEPYLMALQKMREFVPSLRADECLAIEDSERGVISACDAGMTVWAIPTEFTRGLDFSRADRVLANTKEILEWL